MNEINEQIEAWCEDFLDSTETPIEKAVTIYDGLIVSCINDKYYKTTFDICFFRGCYIYDVTSQVSISKDEYFNDIIDNSFSQN